ncbi:transcription factor MYB77-like [Oryza brachyantha]|uniref:transcription factor MYB77-like n=1 Tax=Oryza brachyantha TaxID=4533 RepID=UPI001ADA4761|nr:transcription factor MYB77-like [Oryza brachyantha]
MDREVNMASSPPAPASVPRPRLIVRLRLPPAWTPEEDALLQRLAKENGFRRWSRIARSMPRRRSARSCRDRWRHHLARDLYHRPFTARDDDELLRLHRRLGDCWKEIGRAVYGRTSRVMRRRWKELRRSGFVASAAAAAAARKEEPAGAEDADDEMVESDKESSSEPESQGRLGLTNALASSFASCSLRDDQTIVGSLELGFACMAL